MKRCIAIFMLIACIFYAAFGLTGCQSQVYSERSPKDCPHIKLEYNKDSYPLDHATLQLSIGTQASPDSSGNYHIVPYEDNFLCYAFYFFNPYQTDSKEYEESFDDYKNREFGTLFKEISKADATSGKYDVYVSKIGTYTFLHTEDLTIPKELLTEPAGRIGIRMEYIFCENNTQYTIGLGAEIIITYRVINDISVEFSP